MYAIVIGASKESVYAMKQAQKRGMKVLAFDGDKDAEGLQYAEEAYVVDIRNPENIYKILDEKKITPEEMLVLPVPIGRYLISTGSVNDHYDLPGVRRETTEICTDKWLFHEVLSKAGLRNIWCKLLKEEERAGEPVSYPFIVKPRYGAGSRQVLSISNEEEWQAFANDMPFSEDFILEDMVEGTEYGMDGMVVNGEFHLILARKKLITPPPYRQCVGYISVTPNKENEEFLMRLQTFMQRLTETIKLQNGIVHADLMVNHKETFVIEMSARPSGHRLHDLFTPMVTGVDMINEFINLALKEDIRLEAANTDKVYMIRYFDIEKEVKRIPERTELYATYPLLSYACNLQPGKVDIVKDGHTLMERGYFIVEGETEQEVCKIADDILREFV